MMLRRRTKRKLLVILTVFLLAFIVAITAAGASWGFGRAMVNWPFPFSLWG